MDLKGRLRPGMRIFGADDRDYGAIERYDDDYVYVGQRRIPASAFDRLDNDRLYVGEGGRRYFETDAAGTTEGEIRVPVMEEQVRVEKEVVATEEVGVGKRTVEETERVSDTVRKEEVVVDEDATLIDARERGASSSG